MAFFPSLDTFFKGILVPAIIALAIYLTATYVLYPLYARRQRYAQYLPVSLDLDDSSTLVGRTRNGLNRAFEPVRNTGFFTRISDTFIRIADVLPLPALRRRPRAMSFDSYFGDEELEDGALNGGLAEQRDTRGGLQQDDSDVPSERRLSRELEAGFRDDSDSEDDERARSRR